MNHAHQHRLSAAKGPDDTATRNVTDLRRARQRARATFEGLVDVIAEWLGRAGVETYLGGGQTQDLNRQITALAGDHIRKELLNWLYKRRKTTMGRGFRAAFDNMQQALPQAVQDQDLIGRAAFTNVDLNTAQRLANFDAGLLVDDSGSIAQEVGDRVTRQLRLGHTQGENVQDLAKRVDYVINDGSADGRKEAGVSGQTVRTKGELIAHDAVQDAYNTAATKRYLQNGFRYCVYDATVDTKTTPLCRRLNKVVVDIVDHPQLIPPNHPYCRSGVRPILDLEDHEPITPDDIASSHMQTIMKTAGYRPAVSGQDDFRPTALTQQYGQA
jgi:SPP1 gp7 family putative phage head morphogenesis protein